MRLRPTPGRPVATVCSGAALILPLPALCSSHSALRSPFALARQSALNCFGALQGTFEAGKMHGPGVLEWRDGGTLSMNFHDGRARTTGEAPATLT